MTPIEAIHSLWQQAQGDPAALASLALTDTGEQLPSAYQVGSIAAASIAAQALAAAGIWQIRSGHPQRIEVSMRRALAMFRSERYLTVDGQPPADVWSPIAGYYQAGDGRWIQIHTNFAHHRDGVLRILQCADSREAVAAAIGRWQAAELEVVLAEAGMCAALIRTPQEWQAHPQAAAVAALPLFELIRIGDADPEPFAASPCAVAPDRPLQGVRVLDLSRVIAAPVAGRTLAQQGAQVLAVSAAHLPNIIPLVIDTGRGKRSAQIDLRQSEGCNALRELVGSADIFLQAYRPDTLAARGFSPEELCRLRPGLIYVSLSAYSHVGPWAGRRGFDSLVQSASGIAWQEGQFAQLSGPGKLPCQALDHSTGYLAAFGAMLALQRRSREGGSWLVRVSLAQTGHWLTSMGPAQPGARELDAQEIAGWMQVTDSPFGQVGAVAPVERMSLTPPYFAEPPAPPGTHRAAWV